MSGKRRETNREKGQLCAHLNSELKEEEGEQEGVSFCTQLC